jgi:hypothetical protein
MRHIESLEDWNNRAVTYEIGGAEKIRVRLDADLVRKYGPKALIEQAGYGHMLPGGWVPVYQNGKKIGTVPGTFDPWAIKSRSAFYTPRNGDFIREGKFWVADKMLGPGDFDAIPDFEWDHD